MNIHMHRAGSLFVALIIGTTCVAAAAQPFPSRSVRLMLGYPPGGGVDVLARLMAPKISERWGQQLVVDNRPGASGRVAADLAAKASPDGYTLLMITMSHAVSASLYRNLPYDAAESFSAVTEVASTPLVLLAHPSLPVKSLNDLIALAKTRPGKLNYGSSGIGGSPHLAMELLKDIAGINVVHVPYKGSGLAYAEIIGGQIELVMSALPGALPHIRAGKVRALGLTSTKRSPGAPEIPTIAEQGVPGYGVTHWFGLVAPAGTDRKIIEQLQGDFVTVLRMREVAETVTRAGLDPVGSTPQQFHALLRSDIARWAEVIKQAGITMR